MSYDPNNPKHVEWFAAGRGEKLAGTPPRKEFESDEHRHVYTAGRLAVFREGRKP